MTIHAVDKNFKIAEIPVFFIEIDLKEVYQNLILILMELEF